MHSINGIMYFVFMGFERSNVKFDVDKKISRKWGSPSATTTTAAIHFYLVLSVHSHTTGVIVSSIHRMSELVQTINGGKAWYRCQPGPMVLGEAPIYRASDSTLHWVDALKEPPELHILHIDPNTEIPKGEARVLVLDDSVTVHYFRKGVSGGYICAYYQGVAFMDEKTGKLEVLKEIIPKEERGERRFNDGGVDAKGRFWLAEIDKKVSTNCSFEFRGTSSV